jgi:hypothetical protein
MLTNTDGRFSLNAPFKALFASKGYEMPITLKSLCLSDRFTNLFYRLQFPPDEFQKATSFDSSTRSFDAEQLAKYLYHTMDTEMQNEYQLKYNCITEYYIDQGS